MSEDNRIEQLEFDLGLPSGETVRISVNAHLDDHDPESTLAQEILSKTLKKKLSKKEYKRIEQLIKKLDWHIDLIYRDREIKEEIQKLIDAGTKTYQAVQIAAEKFHLSEEHIFTIWYGKQSSN